ncbi:MFS transporter [Neisseria montereyensis]|uniref:MFS transporter n=1 Tax=Neisseria montereyensis TaxID=2973938 RepID=A0ABT2F961_9NEIS|nr:MFS transporter [Neisseria montereyensis]MCS4532731.1 MFS transporter [Neisseria montereyensis]
MIQSRNESAVLEEAPRLLQLAVFLTGLFAFLQVYSVQAILPVLIDDLQATDVQAGLAVGATVLGVALMSPFTGMLSDAFGRKVFIVGSLLFLGIPTLLLASASTIEQVMFWRFLQGVVVPGITVVLIAYVGEEFGGKAITRLMSLYVSGTVLGGFLGRFILGHLSEIIGWRSSFYVMSALTVGGAFFVWKQLPASRMFEAKPHFQTALNTLVGHLRNRRVVAACMLGACVLCSLVGCFTYINLYLAEEPYALDSGGLANLFAVYLIGMVITPLSARLINRFGSGHTILMAVCLSAIGVLATLAAPLPVVIAGLALMSSGVFITQAATISYIAANVKEGRSLASGLYYMAYYGGGTLGSWLCGLAYTGNGWQGVVWVLLGVQAAALFIAATGMRKVAV